MKSTMLMPAFVCADQLEKTYLAVSNLSAEPYTLILGDLWQDRQTGRVARGFLIPVGEMVLLELREA